MDRRRDEMRRRGRRGGGFTVIELTVSVGISVIVIASAGLLFNGVSRTVGESQEVMEATAAERAVGQLLRRDFAGMNRDGFLVIRSRMFDTTQSASPRFDQVAFLAYGTFANQTGGNDAATPWSEGTSAHAAHIWWGQLVMERLDGPDPSYVQPNQSGAAVFGVLPTGVYRKDGELRMAESEAVLGRHATLLVPGPPDEMDRLAPSGEEIKAYRDIAYAPGFEALIRGAGESKAAHITSSRFAVAGIMPGEIMARGVWENYCYRFKALYSPYDTDVAENPFVNGAVRMQSIVREGVSSVKIDWTDGTVDSVTHEVVWYGALRFKGDPDIESVYVPTGDWSKDAFRDHYVAIFNDRNREKWPRALRFTFHAVSDRLRGGRDQVEVVELPE